MTTVSEEMGEVEGFRLSPQQRHLWHHAHLPGDAASYFSVQCALLAAGPLDADRLRAAAGQLVQRHEILRTGFRCLPGTEVPVQFIDESAAAANLVEVDLGMLADDALEQCVAAWAAEVRAAPPVLDQPPLLRLGLAQVGNGRSVLLVTLPALCADAVGVVNLCRELVQECADGAASAEPLQYADLAEWQNELLEDGDEKFTPPAMVAAPPDLPGLRGLPGEVFQPRVTPLPDLAPTLLARADELAAAHDTTVGVVLATCWQAVLRRLVDGDMVVGVSCEGRSYEGLDAALGLFARDLPLVVEVDPAQPFGALIDATERGLASLLERQEYFTWDRVAGASTAAASATHFFPLGFAYEDWSARLPGADGDLTVCHQHAGLERCQLRLVVTRRALGWSAALHHDAASCDAAGVERLAGWCGRMIAGLLGASEDTVVPATIDLLSPAEREQLLGELSGASVAAPAAGDDDTVIHQLIAEQVAARPDAVAVACGDQSLTYGELDARAAAIAAALQARGVGPGVLVGVCVDRSVELIVGILAALKAGGAYLPLDPSYPQARLRFMLEDAAVPVVLTVQRLTGVLPECSAQTLLLDAAAATAAPAAPVAGGADDLAYVIYTSGSTGQPKGVEVLHRNLVHSTRARAATYGAPPSSYLLLSSFGFDSSVVGIFWTLCGGGTLVLPREGSERDLHEITRLVKAHGVTHTLALPSLYSVMLRETAGAGLDSLDTVIVAGEACLPELVELHGRTLPNARLFNEYGPTEATVWSTVHRCEPGADPQRVPIGRPIQGARVYLLDARQQLVPLGVPGELFVGGPGVTRGYLRRPELTAERFVEDAFGAGERLYRTGDLVRFRADGNLDFLGRTDNQVKIRGYRIELEEIENALRAAEGVAEAVVIARADAAGEKRLVAYLQGQDGDPDEAVLRADLEQRMPDYMVPAAMVAVESMPRMPNGKIDRGALAELDDARSSGEEYIAPRDALDEALVRIWSELLSADTVGIRDNFFRLGGHSLLVTQLIFRLREVFQREVSLRAVFDSPTIEELAVLLQRDGVDGLLESARAWLEGGGSTR